MLMGLQLSSGREVGLHAEQGQCLAFSGRAGKNPCLNKELSAGLPLSDKQICRQRVHI